jgi:hypothetical protein
MASSLAVCVFVSLALFFSPSHSSSSNALTISPPPPLDVTCCGDLSVRVVCWALAASLNGSMPSYTASLEATKKGAAVDEWDDRGKWTVSVSSGVVVRYIPASTSRDLHFCVQEDEERQDKVKWLVLSVGFYDAVQAAPIEHFEEDLKSFFSSPAVLQQNLILRTLSPWTQTPSQIPVYHTTPLQPYDETLKKVSSHFAEQRSAGTSWLLFNSSSLYTKSGKVSFLRSLAIDAEGLSSLLYGLKSLSFYSRLGEIVSADPLENWRSVLFHGLFDRQFSSILRLTFLYSLLLAISVVFGVHFLRMQSIGWFSYFSSWMNDSPPPPPSMSSPSPPPSAEHSVDMNGVNSDASEINSEEYWWEWLLREKVIFTAIRSWGVVASIVFLCYLLDGARAVPAGDKSYEYDTYVFVSIVIALICCLSVQPAHIAKGHSGILNRDQTEEWRGWMQVAFLLYHYYDAKPFYNFIRVFVASYVWQTGFGHFSYFWVRKGNALTHFLKIH